MKNLDQWILVVIACVAVIAPCITTYLNNRHQYKILKIQTSDQRLNNYIECYFDSLSSYISTSNMFSDARKKYFSASHKLYIVVDSESRKTIDEINEILYTLDNWSSSLELTKKINIASNELSKNITQCFEQNIKR